MPTTYFQTAIAVITGKIERYATDMKKKILSYLTKKNVRGNIRLSAVERENQQFYSIYETKIFNSALKKVPK